jgi:hypothetical protein
MTGYIEEWQCSLCSNQDLRSAHDVGMPQQCSEGLRQRFWFSDQRGEVTALMKASARKKMRDFAKPKCGGKWSKVHKPGCAMAWHAGQAEPSFARATRELLRVRSLPSAGLVGRRLYGACDRVNPPAAARAGRPGWPLDSALARQAG